MTLPASQLKPIKQPAAERRLFIGRAAFGFAVVALLFALLAGRYFWLQVLRHDDFSVRSDNNRVRVLPVVPNRGEIYDRRGRLVAENVPAWRLELVPEKIGDLDATWDRLAEVIELDDDDRERFEKAQHRYRPFDRVPVRFDLDEEEVARFAVDRHRFEGVEVVPYPARHYPFGELLTHVVGYVGRLDEADLARVDAGNYRGTSHIGKSGIERRYEDWLHGVSGLERVETNVQGRTLDVLERSAPRSGDDLVLSIDVAVQRAAWDALGDRAGAVVAIDPRDGSVVALVSKPAYDPNDFVQGISSAGYRAILDDPRRPLFNRALQGGYEPGSTLKPFIALAGLELGVVQRSTRVFSSGRFYLPGQERPYRDWRRGGHGWVEVESALEQSVNTYFYQLALDLGIDRIHDYLAPFGFGAETGIDLPGEASGVLPSRAWKRGQLNQPWYPGETVIAGIGQGFNVVTPLQLATAVAALANGGAVPVPRVAFARKSPDTAGLDRLAGATARTVPVRDPDNWIAVRNGMRRVVHGGAGTARRIAPEAGWELAGKTGTAQVFGLAQGQEYREEEVAEHLRHHALFVGFGPYAAPSLAVAAVVDHGGAGSRAAAPVARAVFDAWLDSERVIEVAAGDAP